MSLMTWSDDMTVGHKALDDDHKKLIGMLNDLHNGILSGHRKEALEAVLDKLVAYTRDHFAREEKHFDSTGYAHSAAHKKEHEDLMKKAVDLQKRYKEGASSMLSLETMSMLKGWLSHHILEVDKGYKPFMGKPGAR